MEPSTIKWKKAKWQGARKVDILQIKRCKLHPFCRSGEMVRAEMFLN